LSYILYFCIKPQPRGVSLLRTPHCLISCISTSNHNTPANRLTLRKVVLYPVFLHQTTTLQQSSCHGSSLSYILFLHQTTTLPSYNITLISVVLYLVSTSNHNYSNCVSMCPCVVLYLVSTSNHNCALPHSQRSTVVLYLVSTSNHNSSACS